MKIERGLFNSFIIGAQSFSPSKARNSRTRHTGPDFSPWNPFKGLNPNCSDLDIAEKCEVDCEVVHLQCLTSCENQDSSCISKCTRDFAACVDICPCYTDCPNGCPCPSQSDYCPVSGADLNLMLLDRAPKWCLKLGFWLAIVQLNLSIWSTLE